MCEEDAAADDASRADDGVSAEYCRAGVDGDVVFECRVSFDAPDRAAVVVAGDALCAERDALIHLAVLADDCGFADNDARAVVDEERRPDSCAGVDVDACGGVDAFGHDARDERYVEEVQLVREPVDGECAQARVAEDDLVGVPARGVAVEGGLHVEAECFLDARESANPCVDDARGVLIAAFCGAVVFGRADLRVGVVAERGGDLFCEDFRGVAQDGAAVCGERVGCCGAEAEETGEENAEEFVGDRADRAGVRKTRRADVMDAAVCERGSCEP